MINDCMTFFYISEIDCLTVLVNPSPLTYLYEQILHACLCNNINGNKKDIVPCHIPAVNSSPWGREALKKTPLDLLLSAILIKKKSPSCVELLCIRYNIFCVLTNSTLIITKSRKI